MVSLPSFITFGKVRGSYASVANEAPIDYVIRTNPNHNSTAPIDEVKPEMFKSIEVGTDWMFFDGRLGLDFTMYRTNIYDLFFLESSLYGSAFSDRYINAGKIINKGVELTVDAELISTRNFSWRTAINYAHNRNKIIEIDPDITRYKIGLGNSEGYHSYIAEEGSFGDLYTYKFRRDEQGRIMVDTNNWPLKTWEPEYVGSINPDFSIGWNNIFSYKRVSLGFLINGVFGGKIVSQTESMLDAYGVSKRSADARDNGGVVEVNAVDINGNSVNKIDAYKWYTSVGNRNGILENYVYDRTNVRLTQFALSYDIPVKYPSISVGFVGQNLFFLYLNAPYDPELTMSAGRDSQRLDNFNLPSTRTLGFNIKVNF
jgi:hypothetical protein